MEEQIQRTIRWLESAAEELYITLRRIEDTAPEKAQKWYSAVTTTAGLLAEYPRLGRTGRVAGTREAAVPGTTHIIVYQEPDDVRENEIRILALRDGRRQWPTSFKGL